MFGWAGSWWLTLRGACLSLIAAEIGIWVGIYIGNAQHIIGIIGCGTSRGLSHLFPFPGLFLSAIHFFAFVFEIEFFAFD